MSSKRIGGKEGSRVGTDGECGLDTFKKKTEKSGAHGETAARVCGLTTVTELGVIAAGDSLVLGRFGSGIHGGIHGVVHGGSVHRSVNVVGHLGKDSRSFEALEIFRKNDRGQYGNRHRRWLWAGNKLSGRIGHAKLRRW